MGDFRQVKGSRLGSVIALLGAIALSLACARPALAQPMLVETLTTAENTQPIQIAADHIAAWENTGQQIMLLRGNVVVTQDALSVRMPSAVVWVDLARYQRDRVFHLVIYGEESIRIEGKSASQANAGYVRMATTSRVDTSSYQSKIVRSDQSADQGYQRAVANRPAELRAEENARRASGEAKKSRPLEVVPARYLENEGAPKPSPVQLVDGKGNLPPPVPNAVTYFQPPVEVKEVPSAPIFTPTPPPPANPTAAPRPMPRLSVRPRSYGDLKVQYKPLGDGTTAVIVTGGVTLLVYAPVDGPAGKINTLDIAADRAVIWTKGTGQHLVGGVETQDVGGGAHELYLAGNVEIFTRTTKEVETLRADEVYYDVRRNVAVARNADLEIRQAKLPYPIHITGQEVIRENEKVYTSSNASLFSSFLPSDPGLQVTLTNTRIEERQVERTWFFGLAADRDASGKPKVETQRYFTGQNMVVWLEGVPIFYFPYLKGRVEDPLGPLDNVNVSYNNILGAQFYTTWDMFDLLHMPRPEGMRWRLFLDYLTSRGPAGGTEFEIGGNEFFGIKTNYSGMIRLYGMSDRKQDVLGGDRGSFVLFPDENTRVPINHERFRGWAYGKANFQDLPYGFSVLGQFSFLRDRNFLEQFYLNTHLNDLDQDTYLYVKQQDQNLAWTIMGQVGTRHWMTETDWLPKADFYWLGQSFLDDWLVYNGHASAGYGRLRPTNLTPFAYQPTDVRRDTLRLDLMQDVSVPFYLGPVKAAPYLVGDIAWYSQDTAGDARGRLYGGAGVRWNMPLSQLFPNIQSDLFNVDGIYHKINLTGNYFVGQSSSAFGNFPQLDRLNDDVTDQSLRDIRPWQKLLNPANAGYLTTSRLFNPQTYAIRRLVDTSVDTLDDIHVLQLGVNQRWQTKRGMPGNEHVVDWMTFNLGVSIFPARNRDNFGHTFGILEYDWVWNIGDRTALTSSGFFEPFDKGPRAFDVGAIYQRPDSTTLYMGYRQIDPLQSKAIVASLIYPLSGKYAISASTVWDFGVDVRTYSLLLSRMGTDLLFSFGVSYNSTLNTVSAVVEVLPNLARRPSGRTGALFPTAPMNIDPMVNLR